MRQFPTLLPCLILLAACGGYDEHDHPHLTTGEQLYDLHCALCHRDSGQGLFLKGVPAVRYTEMTDREMVNFIRGHGRSKDSHMPVYSTMPRGEAERIAAYVRQNLKIK